jgi:hypothetical protein
MPSNNIFNLFFRARGESKRDYDLPWGEWQAPSFQRTSSNHPEITPRSN